jgi:hypothetical protein
MHTLMLLIAGFVLLFFCQLVARAFGGAGLAPIAKALLVFVPLWFIVSAVNMWIGINYAGYSFTDELLVFLPVFGIPVIAALLTWWRITHLAKK